MAGTLKGEGCVEVGGCGVNLDGKSGALSERSSEEVAQKAVVGEGSASSSAAIVIAEKLDGVDNGKRAGGSGEKIIQTGNNQKKITAVAADATSKHGKAANTRTVAKRKPVLDAGAAPWTPDDLEQSRALLAQSWKLGSPSTKKLLILDVNGLLVARYTTLDRSIIPQGTEHGMVAKSYMFKRPFCGSFLDFCFENFYVGVWSSMKEANVRKSLDYICKETQHKFLLIMHQGDCTQTGLRNPSKRRSPIFLKELTKVWSKFPTNVFNQSNTLLVDDSPYKALWNPPHTAIFPEAYWYNERDSFLQGTLPEYLTQLRDAADVPAFVQSHPIGVPAIAPGCLHWDTYHEVLKRKRGNLSPLQIIPPLTSLPSEQLANLSLA